MDFLASRALDRLGRQFIEEFRESCLHRREEGDAQACGQEITAAFSSAALASR